MMQTTPGVYFEFVNRRTTLQPLRSDIIAYMGYAERGPVLLPVKIESWRQFVAVFGGFTGYAYLAYAVRGFFDNGGITCYVIRIADPYDVQVASWQGTLDATAGQPQISVYASYPAQAVRNALPNRVDRMLPDSIPADASAGTWANNLAITLQPHSIGSTTTAVDQPEDTRSTYVNGLTGFYTGSYVKILTDTNTYTRRITTIDPATRRLTWHTPLPGAAISQFMRLETVEFSLLVHQDGRIIESFYGLGFHKEHPRFAETTVDAESHTVRVTLTLDESSLPDTWGNSSEWELIDRQALIGGRDGLTTLSAEHYTLALDALAKVSEVSLLAAPDLVLYSAPDEKPELIGLNKVYCQSLDPVPQGLIKGNVYNANSSDLMPLAGVKVTYLRRTGDPSAVGTPEATTDHTGKFEMTGMPARAVSLLLERSGFIDLEVTTEARLSPSDDPAVFLMSPRSEPTIFDEGTVYDIQGAMLRHGQAYGCVVLLDAPYPLLDIENVQTWRRRFDSSYAALTYPWLIVDVAGEAHAIPPSGHMGGIIARNDSVHGVHHAPANVTLDGVRALTHDVGATEHSILNPMGINCIRVLPGRGIRIFGARTLSNDTSLRYLNARRVLLQLKKSLEASTQWAVFEPNNHVLRQSIVINLTTYLTVVWQQGGLVGDTPEAAFRVKCDEDNNPPAIRNAGQLIADIDVALAIPYEFIHFRLGRTEEAVEITE